MVKTRRRAQDGNHCWSYGQHLKGKKDIYFDMLDREERELEKDKDKREARKYVDE